VVAAATPEGNSQKPNTERKEIRLRKKETPPEEKQELILSRNCSISKPKS